MVVGTTTTTMIGALRFSGLLAALLLYGTVCASPVAEPVANPQWAALARGGLKLLGGLIGFPDFGSKKKEQKPAQHHNPPPQQHHNPPPQQHHNPPKQQQQHHNPPPQQHRNPPQKKGNNRRHR